VSLSKNMIGVFISEEMHDLLRLQSLITSTPKATMVRAALQQHILDQGWDLEELIADYAKYMCKRWEAHWKKREDFSAYMERSTENLKKKNLPEPLITHIIRQCHVQQSQNKTQSRNKSKRG